MSSDRTGSINKATKAATGAAASDTGSADSAAVEQQTQAADPWFAAGPKVAAAGDAATGADDGAVGGDPAGAGRAVSAGDTANSGGDTANGTSSGDSADSSDRDVARGAANADATSSTASSDGSAEAQGEWFLRTGRAGLLPDSITVIWDDDGTSVPNGSHDIRVEAAGAPPWAGEAADLVAEPPPWETGPWPGPGGTTAGSGAARRSADGDSAGRADTVTGADSEAGAGALGDAHYDGGTGALDGAGSLGGAGSEGADSGAGIAARRQSDGNIAAASAGSRAGIAGRGGATAASGVSRWSARTVLVAGLVPFVIPGLVVGILGLRQGGTKSVRTASWVAISASLVWAVVIAVIVAGGSGGSAGACGGYPPAIHRAYDKAMADLHDRAPASVLTADLGRAASLANASAAAAGQLGVRTALFTMANDMAQARADVVAGRPVPVTLRTHLSYDASTPSGSCTS
jgi:hypothetical protein